MGRTERPPIDTHTARILNGGIRNLQAKNVRMEDGGGVDFNNAVVSTSGATIAFTGGNFQTQNLTVSSAAAFNGPTSVTSDFTIASTSNFNVNTSSNFNNAINAGGVSTFNGSVIMNNTVNMNDPVNFNDTINSTNNTINYGSVIHNINNSNLNYNTTTQNMTNSSVNYIGTNTVNGATITYNNPIIFNSIVEASDIDVTSNLGVNNLTTTGNSVFQGGATFTQGINVIGPIISNGVTVGDPSNTATLAGLFLQNITGTGTTELIVRRPPEFGTNSLVYKSAIANSTGVNGLEIFDSSGTRSFYLDNETGKIDFGNKNINIESDLGSLIILSDAYPKINLGDNNSFVSNNGLINSYILAGSFNSLSSTTNGSLNNWMKVFGRSNNVITAGLNTLIYIFGDNNDFNISTSSSSIYCLGTNFDNSNIIGNGSSTSKTFDNVVLLGDGSNGGDPCRLILGGGLSNIVAGEAVPTGNPSNLANVKIVTSKTPGSGNALFQIIQDSSSRRYKRNIEPTSQSFTSSFMKLKPSKYSRAGRYEYGLIAEEVADIPEYISFVGINSEGQIDSIEYDRMVVLCIAKIQEQQRTIDTLNKRLEKLESFMSSLI